MNLLNFLKTIFIILGTLVYVQAAFYLIDYMVVIRDSLYALNLCIILILGYFGWISVLEWIIERGKKNV